MVEQGEVSEVTVGIVGGNHGRSISVIVSVSDQVGRLTHAVYCMSVTKQTFSYYAQSSLEAILGDDNLVSILDTVPVYNGTATLYPDLQCTFRPAYTINFVNQLKLFFCSKST